MCNVQMILMSMYVSMCPVSMGLLVLHTVRAWLNDVQCEGEISTVPVFSALALSDIGKLQIQAALFLNVQIPLLGYSCRDSGHGPTQGRCTAVCSTQDKQCGLMRRNFTCVESWKVHCHQLLRRRKKKSVTAVDGCRSSWFWAEFLAAVVPSPFMLPGIQYPIRSYLGCWVWLGFLGSFEKK